MFTHVNPFIYGEQRGQDIKSSVTRFNVRNCDPAQSNVTRRRRQVDSVNEPLMTPQVCLPTSPLNCLF